MGSDLRAGAIEAMAQKLWPDKYWEGHISEWDDDQYPKAKAWVMEQSGGVLDALLDYLEEHIDEWDDAAFQLEKVADPSDDEPLWIGPKHLVAVLREVESERLILETQCEHGKWVGFHEAGDWTGPSHQCKSSKEAFRREVTIDYEAAAEELESGVKPGPLAWRVNEARRIVDAALGLREVESE